MTSNKWSIGSLKWVFLKKMIKDANEPWQLGFQDAGSPVMEEIIMLHDQILFILNF